MDLDQGKMGDSNKLFKDTRFFNFYGPFLSSKFLLLIGVRYHFGRAIILSWWCQDIQAEGTLKVANKKKLL